MGGRAVCSFLFVCLSVQLSVSVLQSALYLNLVEQVDEIWNFSIRLRRLLLCNIKDKAVLNIWTQDDYRLD